MADMLHRLAHWLEWTSGRVETWTDSQGVAWVGFRCSTCGRLSSVGRIPEHIFPKAVRRYIGED